MNNIWRGVWQMRILVIDDEADILNLIKNILLKQSYTVDVYQSPKEVDEEKLSNYDLILLDVMMPDIDGISYCKKVRNKVDCPIIFLTAKHGESDIVEGLSSGADDYIIKPFGINELLARVLAHLRREGRKREHSLNIGDVRFSLSSHEIFVKDKRLELTKSEYQICYLLAKRRGGVFSKEQIYESLFGYDGIGDSLSIYEHIKNIRAKFEKLGSFPITTVWGIGYKWV